MIFPSPAVVDEPIATILACPAALRKVGQAVTFPAATRFPRPIPETALRGANGRQKVGAGNAWPGGKAVFPRRAEITGRRLPLVSIFRRRGRDVA